ncbi:hypothetical protein [Hymenobacter sp. GOD-10R]|uniref:OmpP1/FadL family transporter n=1 Tax=Hymenobacter sp. GOD-10R TaxID=3093922 RepID=UPI002D782211|nr:hypothetical protein [Hymenobacter sp. GOD-10R]WRQ28330.1 hypothetical protein SD425_24995 [Hymenobacter sp. GOD-10R]
MKNKQYWLGLALMGWASHAFAQTEDDALRYSRLQFGGTARTQAIGGSSVAVGADLGSLITNPAGLGLYQKSEISFSPGYSITSSSSTGTGSTTDASRNNLHVASFGVAFTNRKPDNDDSNWRSGTFAVGINRVNNFNTTFRYAGSIEDQRSIFQRFREQRVDSTQIYREDDNQSYETLDGLAYGALLTNIDPKTGRAYTPTLLQRAGAINQSEIVTTKGAQTQYDFGYGANYRDKLYLGIGLGIVSTRYEETRNYQESDNDVSNYFGSLALVDQYKTRGTGFNLRIGAIYRVADMVRIGASVQTPTFMRLTDDYGTTLTSNFSPAAPLGGGQTTTGSTVSTEPSSYTYQLTTPFRASGGVAVTIGKYGFLSGDVEYLNYNQARFNADDNDVTSTSATYTYDAENDAIKSLYHSTVNVRVGGEARLDIFRVRLGYARYGDPYQSSDFDRTQNYITGGVGLRQNNFFLDLTGVYNTNDRFYSPYTLSSGAQPVIAVNTNRFTTTATVGFTF